MPVASASDVGDDRRRGLALLDVSRETSDRLALLVAELRRWQAVKNLVGPGTLDHVWTRHVADSAQLVDHAPDALRWVDLGTGAGFPGLVLAIILGDRPGAAFHLVESNARKCAFLRHAARVTGTPVRIHDTRLERVVEELAGKVEVVTARALAPLADLLTWTHPLIADGAIGLFPKGKEAEAELTEARKSWTFAAAIRPSRTSLEGRILRIEALRERA